MIYSFPETFLLIISDIYEFINTLFNYYISKSNENIFKNHPYLYFNDETKKEILLIEENIFKSLIKCLEKFILLTLEIYLDKNMGNIKIKKALSEKGIINSALNYFVFFGENEIFTLFDFVNKNHSEPVYEPYISKFLSLCVKKIFIKQYDRLYLGSILRDLFNSNKYINIVRNILIYLYNKINSVLSEIEKISSKYKFQQNTDNNSNQEVIQLSEEDLNLLDDNLKDTKYWFDNLIKLYKIATSLNELYSFGCYEKNFLENLLESLYTIIFSHNWFNKIKDDNIIKSYKIIITTILYFYNTIFDNIQNYLKNDNIIKEFSKRRNLYHLKEIKEYFNSFKNQIEENKIDNEIKYFNNFVSYLEEILPEEQTFQLFNINKPPINSEINLDYQNLCPICFFSKIDTHILPCGHEICRNCFFQCLSGNKICPFCRKKINGIKEDTNLII